MTEIDTKLEHSLPTKGRNWFVNSQGQTFAVVNGPVEFLMGEKIGFTEPKKVTLSHSFAIAIHEVTVAQFQKSHIDQKHDAQSPLKPDWPVNGVTWYDAVAYCNWLSEQEGIPKDQWCYQPNDQGVYADGMVIPPDYLERTGYRLPTEEEWEFVCRAGSTSTYGFGEPVELLASYGQYLVNAEHRRWSVGTKFPNALGVFDLHGNVHEWCHGLSYSAESRPPHDEVRNVVSRVLRGGAYFNPSSLLRSAFREHSLPYLRNGVLGFRPSRTYNLFP